MIDSNFSQWSLTRKIRKMADNNNNKLIMYSLVYNNQKYLLITKNNIKNYLHKAKQDNLQN